jgi:type IX secretion system PorP/SprF family membrane protein
MKGFVLFLMLLLIRVLDAQPLARYNLYPFNPDFANPAATGLTNCMVFNVTDMHQWVGIKDAPNIQSFSVQNGSSLFKTKKQGLGLNLVRDINGPSRSTGGELLYSFHVLIGRSHTTWLSFGLSGSFEQRRLDESGFSPVFDPRISGGMVQEIAYNASSGVYLYNDRYFAGFAVYNLLPVNTTLGMGYGNDRYSLSVQGGYLFTGLRIPARVQTSFQASLGTGVYQFDLGARILFNNRVWTGLTLRKYAGQFRSAGQNALVFIGYDWNKWSFCYNYNFDINGTQFHHSGTHQLSLGYRICKGNMDCPAYK